MIVSYWVFEFLCLIAVKATIQVTAYMSLTHMIHSSYLHCRWHDELSGHLKGMEVHEEILVSQWHEGCICHICIPFTYLPNFNSIRNRISSHILIYVKFVPIQHTLDCQSVLLSSLSNLIPSFIHHYSLAIIRYR